MKSKSMRIFSILAIIIFAYSLGACGQKGKLVLPDDESVVKKKKSVVTTHPTPEIRQLVVKK